MECTLMVGDVVVCVDDDWTKPDDRPIPRDRDPVKDGIYTVRDVIPCPGIVGNVGLRFDEIVNPAPPPGGECFYSHTCFKKVRRTDISALRDLVAPVPGARQREKETA